VRQEARRSGRLSKKRLEGETLAWFKLADRLNTPIQRLQAETSSTEFIKWMRYSEQVKDDDSKHDYYLMQIALCLVRANLSPKDAKKLKLSDFRLGFEEDKKPQTKEEATEIAKGFFNGLVNKVKRK